MERYVTSTQLKQNLREIKRMADEDVVHVLENGKPAFVFMNVEVYERRIQEARRRAEWEVDVEESMRDGRRDESCGRMLDLSDVIRLRGQKLGAPVRIAESAARSVDAHYDEGSEPLLVEMMADLSRRPDHGITVEYDSSADFAHRERASARKFCIPPCDILYDFDEGEPSVSIFGVIASIETQIE